LPFQIQELKSYHREVEKLKYDNSSLESKLKYSGAKIKTDAETRETLEKRIEELNNEIRELKLAEINREKEELEVERNMLAERQMIEQNATLILLKHQNEEKARRTEALEKKCHQLENDLETMKTTHSTLVKEHEKYVQENLNLSQQVNDSQCLLDKQMMKIAELQSNQNDLEIIRTQLTLEKNSTRQLKNEIEALTNQNEEANLETDKWRAREIELLQLNKELTETVVKFKGGCSYFRK
jgi:chromosome segregation ATPase